MSEHATVLMTPDIPHAYLGITPGSYSRIVTIKRTVYLVEYFDPAVVPTDAHPGTWKVALATVDAGEAGRYMLEAPKGLRRLVEATQYQAVEVWAEQRHE